MKPSHKSRSRKPNNNRRNNTGNVSNRVFDSAGPEGRVRGTPQQIVEKYQSMAYDAQLSGDRVAAENFLQHSEHYARMLGEAQREMAERREAQDAQRRAQQQNQNQENDQPFHQPQQRAPKKEHRKAAGEDDQPDVFNESAADLFPAKTMDHNLVATPEGQSSNPKSNSRPVKRATNEQKSDGEAAVEVVQIKRASRAKSKPAEPPVADVPPEAASDGS